MKLQKTVDGLFAAPVTAPTVAAAPRLRKLAADVMRSAPELAQYLDFGANAASVASGAAVCAPATLGQQQPWAYRVDLSSLDLLRGWNLHR
jgi:hypothetical protein